MDSSRTSSVWRIRIVKMAREPTDCALSGHWHEKGALSGMAELRGSRLAVACAGLLSLLTLAGCASDRTAAAAGAAQEFYRAFIAGNVSEACSLLQAETREETARTGGAGSCENQLRGQQLPDAGKILHIDIYGRNALVKFENDTVFLTTSKDGWKITAAGCTPNGEAPYRCEVGGK